MGGDQTGAVTDKSLSVVFDWPVVLSGRLWSVVFCGFFFVCGFIR